MLEEIRHRLNLPSGSALTVSTDSRQCPNGCVFFALKGENFDGNRYAASAIENGAALAIVSDPEAVSGNRCMLVSDTLKALQQTAAEYRREFDIPIIAITGTNGKTTTKELIAACLTQRLKVHYTHGNLNNQIGVPLTLLAMPRNTEIAVIETGASHPGDITELVNIAQPTCGLITNVGRAHLQGFGSFEGVIKTKCELYDYLASHNGFAFLNAGNSILTREAEKRTLKTIAYSVDGTACVNAQVIDSNQPGMLAVRVNGKTDIHTNLIGDYNAENVLAAITVATHYGVSLEQCRTAIENYRPTNNRSQLLRTAHNTLIVDAYNANPTSMEAALKNISSMKPNNPMLILGQMGELGDYQREAHQHIIDIIRQLGFTDVLLVGNNFRDTDSRFPLFDTTESLAEYLKQNPPSGKTVLIKGSHSNRLDTITALL